MPKNNKPIRITDVKAIRLAKKRAIKENRSAANAAAVTIIEALSEREHNTEDGNSQD